jgi:hypothetical protein
MNRKQRDEEKARYWKQTIREAARSGISIREFCRQRRLRTSQFYWWQRRLKERRQPRTMRRSGKGQTSFALVSEEAGTMDVGIELVLGDGRRLRIRKGVDEATLRAVLSAVEPRRC